MAAFDDWRCGPRRLRGVALAGILAIFTQVVSAEAFVIAPNGDGLLEVSAADSEGASSLSVPAVWEGSAVKAIGPQAFATCAGLSGISLPASIEQVADGAFAGCASLETISVGADNPFFSDIGGVLCDFAGERLIVCPEGRSGTYTVPKGVKSIAEGAFDGCDLITEIILGTDVTDIGTNAFSGCENLKTVRTPRGPLDAVNLVLPEGCSRICYTSGGLDDPTLPPRWAVSFRANGGSGSMANQVFSMGKAARLRANAYKRTGYTFAGWALSPNGPVAFANGQNVRDLCATPGGTVTLYAKWTGIPYTFIYHEKPKGGRMVSQSFRYGTKTALRKNSFAQKGCVFIGWSRHSASAPVVYKDGQVIVAGTTVPGGKVHLYAQWAVRNYRVRFNANGGRGKMADQTFTYGTAQRLRANAFTRTGCVFVGWSTSKTGPVNFANQQAISALTRNGGRVILYARWRLQRYTIVFDARGGTGTMASQTLSYGQKATLRPLAFSRPEYVFAGWALEPGGKLAYGNKATVQNLSLKDGATVRLYARWAVRNYAVHFDANGGEGSMANEGFVYGSAKSLLSNAFTRRGHHFLGWSRSATATKATYADQQVVQNLTATGGTVTLYAVWVRIGNPNVIVCLGDSITQGYRCYGLPYPSRLARLTGKTVKNYGVGGKKSDYGAATAESAMLAEGPGTVCIQYGANDAIHNVRAAVVKENLRKIIRICRKYQATPILATPTPQTGSHARFNSNVNEIAKQVRALAREENVRLVDLNAAFGSGGKYLNPADGLHLSDAGGDLMARKFYEAIR
ncbi:MAG: InlB B-repeat-containing protein [Victivallales bacterium]|nr:InlB B-repeat-containing protein [Victivallales bacterium]